MVNKCSVPNCKGNYRNYERVTVFRFPKNEVLRRKWIKAINRDFEPSAQATVCIRHFTENQIRRTAEAYNDDGKKLIVPLQKLRLRDGAIPCVFNNNVGKSNCASSKKNIQRQENLKNDDDGSISDSIELSSNDMVSPESNATTNTLKTIDDFLNCLVDHKFTDWDVIQKDDIILFAMITISDVPTISASATVNTDLEMRIFKGKDEIKTFSSKQFPLKISDIYEFEIVLNDLSSATLASLKNDISDSNIKATTALLQKFVRDNNSVHSEVSFLCEQINLLSDRRSDKYSMDYMIFCCVLWLISPYAYHYLFKSHLFVLPHVSTLYKLCPTYDPSSSLDTLDIGYLTYIRQKADKLQKRDMIVSLAVDEVRLKPYFNRMNGDILQKALNITNKARIAQVYTIKSLNSSFKGVVHVLPVREMDSNMSFLLIKKLIIGLHEIGFNVVCVVTNNSPINKGAMSNFVSPPATQIVYKHPVNENKPLFYVFDSAYILQNITKDWANQSDELLIFPEFGTSHDKMSVADFSELEKLCEIENPKYRSRLKSLNLLELKRFNIRSVLNVFNRSVIDFLKQNGEKCDCPHYQTTARFMEIILKWWSIMNAKVVSENVSEDYKFLEDCLVWLDRWASFGLVENKFSDEAHEAFTHTIYGFLQLAEYCRSELNLGYILPSKIQMDFLEARYGKHGKMPIYDTLAGSM